MSRLVKVFLAVAVVAMLANCPSVPPSKQAAVEEAPAQEAPAEKAPQVEEPVRAEQAPAVEPVTDKEVKAARAAIDEAREWGGDYYAADTMKKARAALDAGLEQRVPDPAASRASLASVRELAGEASRASAGLLAEDLKRRMAAAVGKLRSMEADRFVPDDLAPALEAVAAAEEAFADGDYSRGRTMAYATLRDLAEISSRLDERLRWVAILKRDTEQAMADAERIEAVRWTPNERIEVNRLYLAGLEALRDYRLDRAEAGLTEARDAARSMVAEAGRRRSEANASAKARSDELMQQVMRDLEEASTFTAVSEDGAVILPEEWNGEELLKELEAGTTEAGSPDATGGDSEAEPAADTPVSLTLPVEGGTVVMGEISGEDLLKQAKELWKLGIEVRNAGEYEKSLQYFAEASRAVEAYKQQVVKGLYEVRLILKKRDALWRIAEYTFVYRDPWLWPLIWMRNKDLVENPDLIEPGMKLVIPHEERARLAEANWLVGKQYEKVGNAAKAKSFMALARILDPHLNPDAIVAGKLPSAAELLARSSARYLVPPRATVDYTESVRSFFLRLDGPLADRDTDRVLGFFSGTVFFGGDGVERTREDIRAAFDGLFGRTAGQRVSLARIYDLASISIAEAAAPVSWGPTYSLNVQARVDLSVDIPFWAERQRFWVSLGSSGWRIFAVGESAPPAGWEPVRDSPVASSAAPTSGSPSSSAEGAARDAFIAFVASLLSGDVDDGLLRVAPVLQILRLNDSLAGDRLRASLAQYGSAAGREAAAVEDLFDMAGLFVDRSDRFGDQAYRVSARAKVDLSASVPFWSEYQEYYLAREGDAWRVVAIF